MNILENKKEIIARYPLEYICTMIGLTGMGFFCLLICSLVAPPEQKKEIISLISGISVLLFILNIGFKRYKIILSRDGIIEVPILGKKKKIRFEEIESVKIRRSKAISVSGKKKKIYIDPAVTEYKQIFFVLSDKGFIQSVLSHL